MKPVEIRMIPHDGGPCPVSGTVIIKTKCSHIHILFGCEFGSRLTRVRMGFYDVFMAWSDVTAYCPIEIKEE